MFKTDCKRSGRAVFARAGLAVALLGPGLSMAAEVVGTVLLGNAPAPNVTVSLGTFTATSDGAGRFLIRNVPPQSYALKCGSGAPVQVQIRDGLNQVSCQAR